LLNISENAARTWAPDGRQAREKNGETDWGQGVWIGLLVGVLGLWVEQISARISVHLSNPQELAKDWGVCKRTRTKDTLIRTEKATATG